MKRPSFLFIVTDQQRADHLSCYGNRVLRTPQVDAIASRGVRFDRHYVAMPICMPNRASLMTGRMPTLHGVRHNGIELSVDAVTLPELLAGAGYDTALVGKSHLQNVSDIPPQYGPDMVLGREGRPAHGANTRAMSGYLQEGAENWSDPDFRVATPYYGFGSVDLVTRHGDRCGGNYLRWALEREPAFSSLVGRENALPAPEFKTRQGWRTRVPESLYSTAYIGERAIQRLNEFARAPERPFFLYCSFPDPHHPWTPPGRYWDMYKPEDIPLPPAYWGKTGTAWSPEGRTGLPHLDYYRDARDGLARHAGRASSPGLPIPGAYACDPREAQEAIALNYGALSMIDDTIGRIIAEIARLGMDRDTVVIFTSDHGDYMGDHQMMLKSSMHYQGLIRTPCIWADPAMRSQAGTTRDQLTSAVDMARSVLMRANVTPADGMQGIDLNPVLADPTCSTRDAVLIEDEDHRPPAWLGFRSRSRTLVTRQHRLSIRSGVAWGELYDLNDDPWETRNLWSSPGHADLRSGLTERLALAMIDNYDTLPKPTRFG